MRKQLHLAFVFFLFVVCSFAQLNKALTYFNNYEYSKAIPLFAKIIKHDSNIVALQRLADSYRILKDYPKAEAVYEKVILKNNIDPLNFFYYGLVLKNNGKSELAREQFVRYSQLVPSDKNTNVSIKSCDDLKIWLTRPPHFEIQNVKEINTNTSEFCPVIYENKLVFTAERAADFLNFSVNSLNSQPYLDVYYSFMKEVDGKINYEKQRPFPSPINSDYHDGPISFSTNGTIYLTRVYNYARGKNFINRPRVLIANEKKGGNKIVWSKPTEFQYNSDDYTVEHPAISFDGNTLFFSSDMPGGFGGKDIWLCRKTESGWSKPENLGTEVNTSGNELFPYMCNNGILYFSSDGQPGFGGLDIFSVVFENNKWTNVTNLGLPLNSTTDDFGICFTNDFQKGYFSSNRTAGAGADDIYSFIVATKSIDVSGKILMSQQLNDPAKNVKIFLITDDGRVINFTTSDSLGFFKFTNLAPDKKYLVKIDENDPLLQLKQKLFMADSSNKIVRVTVVNNRGDKFVFQSLPFDKTDAALVDDNNNGLSSLAGYILFGDKKSPVSNVRIDLVNEAGDLVQSTITNSAGAFVFSQLVSDQNYFVKLNDPDSGLPPNAKITIVNTKGDIVGAVLAVDKGFRFRLLSSDQAKLKLTNDEYDRLQMNMSGKLIANDEKRTPISNVKVNLLNERGEVLQSVYTDVNGKFEFAKLPADKNFVVRIADDDDKLSKIKGILLTDEKDNTIAEIKNTKDGFRYKCLTADGSSFSLMSVDDSEIKFSMKGKIINGDGTGKPAANTKVNLLNEKGETLQSAYTDEQGNFVFTKLPSDQNFFVSIDEKEDQITNAKKFFITDVNGKTVGEVKADKKGRFKYEILTADINSFALMEVEEQQMKADIIGKLISDDDSGKGLANKRVRLVNEKGEVIDSTYTDESGKFVFKSLPSDQKYLVKLDEEDVTMQGKLKLVMTDVKGNIVREIAPETTGVFSYELLSADRELFSFSDESDRLGLRGRVLVGNNAQLNALPNSIVRLYDANGKLLQKIFTDNTGYFYFFNLPANKKFTIAMDEKDPKLIAAARLVLTDENGVTIRDLKGKERFRFELLSADMKTLLVAASDDSWSNIKLLGKQLFSDTLKSIKSEKPIAKPAYGYGLFENLYFGSDDFKLSAKAKEELMKVVEFVEKTPNCIIELDGHADSRMGQRHNLFLSYNRARSAKNFLVWKGVNVNRLKAVAFGKKQLAVPCSESGSCTELENAPNRRVEIKVKYRK